MLATIEKLESPTLGALATAEQIQPPSVTRLVQSLVDAGLCNRTVDPTDRRSQRVALTSSGKRELALIRKKKTEFLREKIAALRPTLRTEVKEPRVLRFDPAGRAVWSVAVLPDAAKGSAMTPVELTNWSEQVLKKRLENVRGVGSVTLVGGTRREINVYLQPQAMEALGITAEQVVAAVRNENQEFPLGTVRSREQDRVVKVDARIGRPEDFARIVVAQRGAAPVRLGQVARISDGAQEVENLALYNGQRTLLLQVQKAQDENTLKVIDGLNQALREVQAQAPAGMRLENVADIKADYLDPKAAIIASEFCGTSITSLGTEQSRMDAARRLNPHVHHARAEQRGYVRLQLQGERLQADLRLARRDQPRAHHRTLLRRRAGSQPSARSRRSRPWSTPGRSRRAGRRGRLGRLTSAGLD